MGQAAEQVERQGGAGLDARSGDLGVVGRRDQGEGRMEDHLAGDPLRDNQRPLHRKVYGVVLQQPLHLAAGRVDQPQPHARSFSRHPRVQRRHHQQRYEIRADQGEGPLEPGRIEAPRANQGLFNLIQRLADDRGEFLCSWRRRHLRPSAYEQLVVQQGAQPAERLADRRLGQPDLIPGAGNAAFTHQGVEHPQQVQVERAKIHSANAPHINDPFPLKDAQP